jgi:hypothetical protein
MIKVAKKKVNSDKYFEMEGVPSNMVKTHLRTCLLPRAFLVFTFWSLT